MPNLALSLSFSKWTLQFFFLCLYSTFHFQPFSLIVQTSSQRRMVVGSIFLMWPSNLPFCTHLATIITLSLCKSLGPEYSEYRATTPSLVCTYWGYESARKVRKEVVKRQQALASGLAFQIWEGVRYLIGHNCLCIPRIPILIQYHQYPPTQKGHPINCLSFCRSQLAALPHHNWVLRPVVQPHLHRSHRPHHLHRYLIDYPSEDHAFSIQLRALPCTDPEKVSVAVLDSQVDQGKQSHLVVLDLEGFIFKETFLAPDGNSGLAVDSTTDKVPSLDEPILYYFVEAGVLVAGGGALPQVLPGAKLAKVLSSLGAEVLEELEGEPAQLLLVGLQIQKHEGIVLVPGPNHLQLMRMMMSEEGNQNSLVSLLVVLPLFLPHLLNHLELVVVLRPLLPELLPLLPGRLLLLVLHLPSLLVLLQLLLQLLVQLGYVHLFVVVGLAVDLGRLQGLLEGYLLRTFGLRLHFLIALGGGRCTSELGRQGVLGSSIFWKVPLYFSVSLSASSSHLTCLLPFPYYSIQLLSFKHRSNQSQPPGLPSCHPPGRLLIGDCSQLSKNNQREESP